MFCSQDVRTVVPFDPPSSSHRLLGERQLERTRLRLFGSEFAQFGFQVEALLFAATRDDDPGAFPRESDGGRPPDAGEGPGK
jgi:hypothetical protein